MKSVEDVSLYTRYAAATGVASAWVLMVLFPRELLELLLPYFGHDVDGGAICGGWLNCFWRLLTMGMHFEIWGGEFMTANLALSGAGLLGYVLLLASAQLDFVHETDRLDVTWFLWVFLIFLAVSWLLMGWIWAEFQPDTSNGPTTPIGALFKIAWAIPTLFGLLIVPPLHAALFVPICFGFFVGGCLCLPRAIVFWTTSSKLKRPYEAGVEKGKFDAGAVSRALGEPSSSAANVKVMYKDIKKMQDDIAPRLARLREENDRLSAAIQEDTERLELEAELSRNMAELEELTLKNKELQRYAREMRKR